MHTPGVIEGALWALTGSWCLMVAFFARVAWVNRGASRAAETADVEGTRIF